MPGNCVTCGKATDIYKCNVCGDEASEHDDNHGVDDPTTHPKGAAHCMPRCVACKQAEVSCTCQ